MYSERFVSVWLCGLYIIRKTKIKSEQKELKFSQCLNYYDLIEIYLIVSLFFFQCLL